MKGDLNRLNAKSLVLNLICFNLEITPIDDYENSGIF